MTAEKESKQLSVSNVLPYIQAAAAGGFRAGIERQPTPRSSRGWVDRCREAAEAAAGSLKAAPPPRSGDPISTIGRLLIKHGLEEPDDENELLSGKELEQAAQIAAATAFRACMPLLVSRKHTQAFIACVAAGTTDGHITGQEAKTLLYNAQLALAAYKDTKAKPSRAGKRPNG